MINYLMESWSEIKKEVDEKTAERKKKVTDTRFIKHNFTLC